MKGIFLLIFFILFINPVIYSQNFLHQQNMVKGIVLDSYSRNPIQNVQINIRNSSKIQVTNADGVFYIKNLISGKYILEIKLKGYDSQSLPIELFGKTIDLGAIYLVKEISEDTELSLLALTEDELSDNSLGNTSGILQAYSNTFLRVVAFDFSSSFFRIKGLDSRYRKVLINGIEMNKTYNGAAQWSNWGGLNDVLRDQDFSYGLAPSYYTFGGPLGSTNISTRASNQRAGVEMSFSSSNRSYNQRAMATYSTGVLKKGWAFTFSGSRRVGIEGFNQGTTYNAYSLFSSLEKIINDKHSINFTSIFAPNRRGKSSPNTQEVYDLKGISYNDYWGYLNGRKTNSRIKRVEEPILMLNHFWKISNNNSLQTNVAYQFGEIGNSRIDFNGGSNPSPTYYQKLPSYFISNKDFEAAYESKNNFISNGQIDWKRIFDANITNASAGIGSAYVLYEDRNDDKQLTVNTILNTKLTNNITLNAKLEFKNLQSHNFAEVIDLLGGAGYLDIDPFAQTSDSKQNDLLNKNRIVRVGEKFKYNYKLYSQTANAFVQGQFSSNKFDFYSAINLSKTTHQREGIFLNGGFPDNSLGKSEKLNFNNYGVKAGAIFKITGRHLLDLNFGFLTGAPTIRNSFSNSRDNNNIVKNLQSEKIFTADFSYILRSPKVMSKITTYYTSIRDATEISFFFADGIGGDNTDFVQEVLSNINKRLFGLEIGIEAKLLTSFKLKLVASIGQFTYSNNPNLYLTSEDDAEANSSGFVNGYKDFGQANLKNYKLAAGPQKAYSVGLEYRSEDYWWVGATSNFFSNIYIDVAPLTRTNNIYLDSDGLPFENYDVNRAKELLKQERFDNYMVFNLTGGKYFKIYEKSVSLFIVINNLLDTKYKTGGFEQGRNANYNQLNEDKSLDSPLFGNKYWYGRGRTYFLNVRVRL